MPSKSCLDFDSSFILFLQFFPCVITTNLLNQKNIFLKKRGKGHAYMNFKKKERKSERNRNAIGRSDTAMENRLHGC